MSNVVGPTSASGDERKTSKTSTNSSHTSSVVIRSHNFFTNLCDFKSHGEGAKNKTAKKENARVCKLVSYVMESDDERRLNALDMQTETEAKKSAKKVPHS